MPNFVIKYVLNYSKSRSKIDISIVVVEMRSFYVISKKKFRKNPCVSIAIS